MRKIYGPVVVERRFKMGVEVKPKNLLIEDVEDMPYIEEWEDTLERKDVPFTVTYRTKHAKVVYSIYANRIRGGFR